MGIGVHFLSIPLTNFQNWARWKSHTVQNGTQVGALLRDSGSSEKYYFQMSIAHQFPLKIYQKIDILDLSAFLRPIVLHNITLVKNGQKILLNYLRPFFVFLDILNQFFELHT